MHPEHKNEKPPRGGTLPTRRNLYKLRWMLLLLGMTLPNWIVAIFGNNSLQGEHIPLETHLFLYFLAWGCFGIGGGILWVLVNWIHGYTQRNKFWVAGLTAAPWFWLLLGFGEVFGGYLALCLIGIFMLYHEFTKPEMEETFIKTGIVFFTLFITGLFLALL